jgi:mRNA-degrading endonuclease RelE of RelBE toxin-antitoxin system
MASFNLQWRTSTRKDLRRIPREAVSRIGDYRVVYELLRDTKIVEIQRVRHRKDAYR